MPARWKRAYPEADVAQLGRRAALRTPLLEVQILSSAFRQAWRNLVDAAVSNTAC